MHFNRMTAKRLWKAFNNPLKLHQVQWKVLRVMWGDWSKRYEIRIRGGFRFGGMGPRVSETMDEGGCSGTGLKKICMAALSAGDVRWLSGKIFPCGGHRRLPQISKDV